LISDDNNLLIYNAENFENLNKIAVPTKESDTIDAIEILYMKLSQN